MSTTEQKALALTLADQLEDLLHDWIVANDAAAELRRLSAENEALRARMDTTLTMVEQANRTSTELLRERDALRAQVEALTKALDGLAMLVPMDGFHLDNPTLEQAGRPRPRTGHRQRDSGAARGAAGVHGGQLSPA